MKEELILREHYLKPIRDFYDSDLIKIITGIRRCGKSIILDQIESEIRKISNNIISLDFEDKLILSKMPNAKTLIEYINNNRKTGKCYVFLDEIQEIENWQDACKTLRLHNISLFITGSNSKLLSKEFTKELSGRYISFRIRPFVYKEILEYSRRLDKDISVTDYLVWGGFPKRFEMNSKESEMRYLAELNQTIVINDLINRYKIRKENLFKDIVNFILKSNGRIVSAKSIEKYIKEYHTSCSVNTIIKYLDYLEEAYIIEKIKQYSSKSKAELSYTFKLFAEDVSLNSIRCLDGKYDLSHNMENIVYNELIYMGYNLMVYDNNGKEIDFLAQKDNKKYYIQVALSVAENKAYEREFKAFDNLKDDFSKKILITNDELDYSTSMIEHLKLKDFLLKENLD